MHLAGLLLARLLSRTKWLAPAPYLAGSAGAAAGAAAASAAGAGAASAAGAGAASAGAAAGAASAGAAASSFFAQAASASATAKALRTSLVFIEQLPQKWKMDYGDLKQHEKGASPHDFASLSKF
jgi:hypothetical protein